MALQTPPRNFVEIESRSEAVVRQRDTAEMEETTKRAKTENQKKQRIRRLQVEYEERVHSVKMKYADFE